MAKLAGIKRNQFGNQSRSPEESKPIPPQNPRTENTLSPTLWPPLKLHSKSKSIQIRREMHHPVFSLNFDMYALSISIEYENASNGGQRGNEADPRGRPPADTSRAGVFRGILCPYKIWAYITYPTYG